MKKLSSNNLDLLPNPIQLKSLCQSIAVLEAIISPEWQYRYYSYNKNWAKGEEFCQMRNGSGDEILILFGKTGTVINGFAHESSFQDKDLITKNLAKEFHPFIFGEPVASIGTTFCIWTIEENKKWTNNKKALKQENFCDGSEEFLELLDGKPETFHEWAEDYYDLENLSLDIVKQIYSHTPITRKTVKQLNPTLKSFKQLKEDLEEIGYAYKL
ncbi:MAG: hypothetical protein JKY03_11570 [Aureispira sp.]|nr:hypothetical protein [Aureispira sp.]